MGDKVSFEFTLFIQKHIDHSYTVKVVEFPDIVAHGVVQSRCYEEVRTTLIKIISKMEPEQLQTIKRIPGGKMEIVEVEFQPTSKSGRRRKTKLVIKFSIIVIPHKEQFLVIVPKLSPPMKFYIDKIDNLDRITKDELKDYFHDSTTEEIMEYEYAEEEKLDTISVKVNIRSPSGVIEEKEKETISSILAAGEDLTEKAKKGELSRAFQVDDIVQEIIGILALSKHESILLIGPTQVGKTAVINEIAHRIAKKQCGASLHNREIWRISVESIAAFSLHWEWVLKNLVKYAREENLIVYFEDITRLIEGIGLVTHGAEMAKFLKEPIASGEIQIISEIAPEQYERYLSRDFGFLSLFKTIRVMPADEEKTYKILNSVRKALELKDDISIDNSVIDVALEITKRFRPYWVFPGKAVKLLKQTVSAFKPDNEGKKVITKEHVFKEFSRQTGLPTTIISETPPLDLEQVRQFFTQKIVGQEKAVEEILDLISTIKAGINDPEKPLGTFIFLGPTGVGKTYLAKTIADYLFGNPERLIRLDMSEYSGNDALLKLLGVPGSSKEGGELTQKIIEQPFSLILLDEIEKAHYTVFDMLLQVLGEGRLTDASGITVDFRNAVIIMTSNLGASHKELSSIGFLEKGISIEQHFIEKLENFFRPEFINRIDHIIIFNPLSKEEIRKIAEKELEETVSRYGFMRRRVNIEIDDQIIELITEKGFSPIYGARPLKRTIEKLIIAPIARYLATHREEGIGLLRVSRRNDSVIVKTLHIKDPEVKISMADPFVRKFGKIDLTELQLMIGKLRRRVEGINQSDKIYELTTRMHNLLKEMRKKEYYKKSDEEKRELNQQVYYLDRVFNRVKRLVDEANFLEDLADVVDRKHDFPYIAELGARFDQLQRELAYLEIEVAYAHVPEAGRGLLLLRRIGEKQTLKGETDWLKSIFNMYLDWIIYNGYTYGVYELVLPAKEENSPMFKLIEFSKVGELKDYVQRLSKPIMFLFYVRGANIYGFLQGEKGIHRFIGKLPGEEIEAYKYRLVKVECLKIESGKNVDKKLQEIIGKAVKRRKEKQVSWLEAFATEYTGTQEIAREYKWSEERQEVIDAKTGLRTKEIRKVLAGDIDPFILAYLKDEVLSLQEI